MKNNEIEVEIDNVDDFLDWVKWLSKNRNIYIAGAGKVGKEIGKFLTEKKIKWQGYVDRNLDIPIIQGKKVYAYSKGYTKDDYFIISSFNYKEAIMEELLHIGISKNNIFMPSNMQNIIDSIYDSMAHWREYTKIVRKFYDRYCEKRCFIVGNGPSLRISDLEKLKKEIAFASNSIYELYDNTSWRPTFHCAMDSIACKKMMSQKEDIQMIISECKAFFTDVMSEGFLYRNCDDINNLFYIKSEKAIDPETGLPLFSNDCSKQVYVSGTISYIALQLAVYMGFREIYLLGMDSTYSIERHCDGTITRNNVVNYHSFIQESRGTVEEQIIKRWGAYADIDMQINAYKSAKNYADTHNIKIYNATRGGKLEVFERVDFDSLF